VDTIHADVNKVPTTEIDVAGYVSGTSDIEWTAGDWARFHASRRIRIWQGYGPKPAISGFEVIDIETGAVTPQQAADEVALRVAANIQWTLLYGGRDALAQTAALIRAKGNHVWNGHVLAWLADWNLNRDQAASLISTYIDGMTCVGVQWASPSSNPHTLLPGSTLTLAQANCDLSVVSAGYVPNSAPGLPVTPLPTPPPVQLHGMLVRLPDGTPMAVRSADGGHTWNI